MNHLIGIIAKLANEGEQSVRKHEVGPRLRGGLEGFRIARGLTSVDEFDTMIRERHQRELELKDQKVDSATYWEYRYATVQLEYCRDILIVHEVLRGERRGSVSCRACIKYHEIFPN